MEDMFNNIIKNSNSKTWKTPCKEGKKWCKRKICKHTNAKVSEICSNMEPLEAEIRAKI